MSDHTLTDQYVAARKARDAALEQFDAAVPGWPDKVETPVGAAALKAHQDLLAREEDLATAREALLESLKLT